MYEKQTSSQPPQLRQSLAWTAAADGEVAAFRLTERFRHKDKSEINKAEVGKINFFALAKNWFRSINWAQQIIIYDSRLENLYKQQ